MRRAYEARYRMLGLSLFRQCAYREARGYLGQALHYQRVSPVVTGYYLMSCMPVTLLDFLRRVKTGTARFLGGAYGHRERS
jgi:hypothetical protein